MKPLPAFHGLVGQSAPMRALFARITRVAAVDVPVLILGESLPYLDFRGTFAPFFRASESPMAIACLRLRTRLPLPLFSVPDLRLCIADLTAFFAPPPYLAMISSSRHLLAATESSCANSVPLSLDGNCGGNTGVLKLGARAATRVGFAPASAARAVTLS
jgi:hypothetical protein